MSIYDDMCPEDIIRMVQEQMGPPMDTQARFREIESLCRRLETRLKSMPELRLGQLLSCSLGLHPPEAGQDIFYVEDQKLIEAVDEFIRHNLGDDDESSPGR